MVLRLTDWLKEKDYVISIVEGLNWNFIALISEWNYCCCGINYHGLMGVQQRIKEKRSVDRQMDRWIWRWTATDESGMWHSIGIFQSIWTKKFDKDYVIAELFNSCWTTHKYNGKGVVDGFIREEWSVGAGTGCGASASILGFNLNFLQLKVTLVRFGIFGFRLKWHGGHVVLSQLSIIHGLVIPRIGSDHRSSC